MHKDRKTIEIKDIAQIGLMVAVIEVSKAALCFFPNIELTSFWLIMFTLYFGWKIVFVVPVFILIEGAIYGVGLWWIMYLYAWPILIALTFFFRKNESMWLFCILSSAFGFCFGFLCSFPYFFIGAFGNGIRSGLISTFTWWVAGIPWDIVHGVGNFILMAILYKPISMVMRKLENKKV